MKKEIWFNINQVIWITLHALLRGASYLFIVGLTHAQCVLFSSERNETFPIFGKISIQIENRKLLKIEISVWATLDSTVSYYMLVKNV